MTQAALGTKYLEERDGLTSHSGVTVGGTSQ